MNSTRYSTRKYVQRLSHRVFLSVCICTVCLSFAHTRRDGGGGTRRRPPSPCHDNGGARHLALRRRTADDLLDRVVLAAGAELSVPHTAADQLTHRAG